MAKDQTEDQLEETTDKSSFLKLFKDGVLALKTIASEQRKQSKLLAKISEDLGNISTDIEEIKTEIS